MNVPDRRPVAAGRRDEKAEKKRAPIGQTELENANCFITGTR